MISKKGKVISICLATMACSFFGATITLQNASADTGKTGRFYMEDGAGIRIATDYSGIRWKTVVEDEWFNQNVTGDVAKATFGALVAPKGTTITWEAYKAQQATPDTSDDMIVNVVAGYKQSAGENEDTVYYSVINYNNLAGENNLQEAYALELEAVSYAVLNEGMDTEQVIWAERNDTCRSAKLVANTALYRNEVASADITRAQQYQGTAETVEVAEELSVELATAANAQTVAIENVNGNVAYVAIGAQKYARDMFTLTDNELTFKANVLSKARAGETNLSIVYEDGSIENYPFIVATQYIDSAEDLAIFGLGGYHGKVDQNGNVKQGYHYNNYIYGKGTKDSFKAQSGYYLVTQDIDASKYTHEYSAFPGYNNNYTDWYGLDDEADWAFWQMVSSRPSYPTENKELTITVGEIREKGLTGTFDGGGHRITGLTLAGYGLFGAINDGAVVKDVAFMETTLGADESDVATNAKGVHTFLAPWVYDAKLENVYVQISDVKNAYDAANSSPAFVDFMRGTTMSNCVIEWAETPNERYTRSASLVKDAVAGSTFNNVYVVASIALSPKSDAENMSAETQVAGVRRYEAVSALDNYFATNNDKLQAFDNPTWTIGNGKLQWGDNQVLATEKIEKFSAYKDDAVMTQADLQRVFGTTKTVKLLSASQPGGKALTVSKVENTEDYKVVGITPNFKRLSSGHIDGVDYTSVNMTAMVDGKKVDIAVSVKAYSRIIDEASDLKMFEAMAPVRSTKSGTATWVFSNVEIFDGYYILAKNIDASDVVLDYFNDKKYSPDGDKTGYGYSGWFRANYKYPGVPSGLDSNLQDYYSTTGVPAQNMGLTGTFDGNGYTISGLQVYRYGMFPWIGETGWVKNVALVDVSDADNNLYSHILATTIFRGAKLSNIYIDGEVSKATTGVTKGLVAYRICENVKIENCIFKTTSDITSENSSVGSLVSVGSYTNDTPSVTLQGVANGWSSVYVISGTKLCKTTSTVWDASNKVATGETSVTGVKRYDDVDEMKKAQGNVYTSFSDAYWDKTSGIPVWKKLPTA